MRWSARPDVTPDQLAQLYLTAPQQIETLLATEGYFSPKVQSTLEEPAGKWIARFEITPGEPTKVTSVQINFSGAVMRDPDREKRLAQARKAFTIKTRRRFPAGRVGGGEGRRRQEASGHSDSPPRM